MKYYLITAVLYFFMLTVSAQTSMNDQAENCLIHLNKSFYVTGEVVWYKVYFPKSFAGKNISVRVGICEGNGQLLTAVFHKTHNEPNVNGYYKIPFDLKPGIYHLVVLGTQKQINKSVILAEALVPIYSDLEDIKPQITEENWQEEATVATLENLDISIELPPGPIRAREKIRAQIRVTDKKGKPIAASISISIKDQELHANPVSNYTNIVIGEELSPDLVSVLDSSLTFLGSLKDTLGQGLKANLLGIYSIKEQTFTYTRSDEGGLFRVELPTFYGEKPIQFMEYQYEAIEVELQSMIPLKKHATLVYTPEILAFLEASRKRKKIYQLHNSFEFLPAPEPVKFNVKPFQPDKRFFIQQYERFASLSSFFKEISTPLKFLVDENGHTIAKMFNPASRTRRFYQNSPIFIVDGKLTRNAAFVDNLDITQIETVDLMYDFDNLHKRFVGLGINGLAIISTNLHNLLLPPDDEATIFTIHGMQSKVVFPGASMEELAILPEEAPFLQPQLYWNPLFKTNEKGELTLEFIQSDDLSRYRIEVMAQGKDGSWGIGWLDYEVQP